MRELAGRLALAYGPSGSEDEVRETIRKEVSPWVDQVSQDALGNLIAVKRGVPGSKSVMLVAHMDEPGLMVTHVEEEGFLRFSTVGNVDPQVLVGTRVRFRNGALGVVSAEAAEPARVSEPKKFFIDSGLGKAASGAFRVGDMAVMHGELEEMGNLWVGKTLDNRVGCAVLIEAARELSEDPGVGNEVQFVFATQSELGIRGARTCAYGLCPDLGLAVEVVEAHDTPKTEKPGVGLGQGVAIKVKDQAIIVHRGVRGLLEETARQEGIPYQREVRDKGFSDAAAIQLSRAGIPAGALSVPCRYRLTPSESLDPKDVDACLRLLTAVLRGSLDIQGRRYTQEDEG